MREVQPLQVGIHLKERMYCGSESKGWIFGQGSKPSTSYAVMNRKRPAKDLNADLQ